MNQPCAHHQTVLVIDDQPFVIDAIHDILEIISVGVLSAENGRDGLAIFQENQSCIDLILLDLSMPGLSGEETYQLIRNEDSQIPVIFTSGRSVNEASHELSKDPNASFLQKPYTLEKLVRVVQEKLKLAENNS